MARRLDAPRSCSPLNRGRSSPWDPSRGRDRQRLERGPCCGWAGRASIRVTPGSLSLRCHSWGTVPVLPRPAWWQQAVHRLLVTSEVAL